MTDNQLLAVARKDLQLTKKLLDQMEEADKKHQKTMDSLLQGFTSLTSALNNGFGLVGSLLSHPATVQLPLSTSQVVHQTASFYDFPDFSYRATMNRNNNDFAKLGTIFGKEKTRPSKNFIFCCL